MKSSKCLLAVSLVVCLPLLALAADEDVDRMIVRDMPHHIMMQQYGRIPGQLLTNDQLAELASLQFTGDTLKLLAILVEWSDRPGTYPWQTFDSTLFSRDIRPTGSVADYIDEVSYGQMAVAGGVVDWYDAGKYKPNWGSSDFTELLYILDPVIDYSQYDGDGDGIVDAICFVRSGNGQEDSGDPDDIWSYAVTYYSPFGPFDGVMIQHWNTSPETRPLRDPEYPLEFSGVDTLSRIRVFAHELAHNFGLPDLYDYDDKLVTETYYTPDDNNDHPLVDWCLMGYGGYGILSLGMDIPAHLCGWSKMKMEWIEPITLEGEFEDLIIYDIETHTDSSFYMLPIDPSEGEYFLLEYRNPASAGKFDKFDSDFCAYFWPDLTYGNDPLDRGLLITHVHDSLVPSFDESRMNNGTPEYPHYVVAVEDAGYDPARDYTYNPEGRVTDSAQWWYPYETRKGALFSDDVVGQSEFGPSTVPNSDGYAGPTGIYIRVDSIVGDRMFVYVNHTGGSGSCCNLRGDLDGNEQVDVLDIDFFIEYLYRSGPAPDCEEEADVDGSGQVDVLDIDGFIDWLYRGSDPPVPCP
ncbi:MAG: M6 family metalloprotease domain-containing protein [Candidatus Zixiibacteriota bacterium]|nr:MAG: M6 family metalloprotease domain-containing protein [candidate division Zixibacteria bacterium]